MAVPTNAAAVRTRLASTRRGALAPVPTPPRPFDVLESKLRIPELGSAVVSRPGLVNRLRAEPSRLVSIVAPAGYGKTALLAQWASRDDRAVAWLTFDERDNDPRTLLRHLVAAFERVTSVDEATLEAVAADGDLWPAAVPRFTAAVASSPRPFVFVGDATETLGKGEAAELLLALLTNVPEGSVLALAGRTSPPLPFARIRAAGRLRELETADLVLDRREAQLLVRGVGVKIADDRLPELIAKTEGWAAGLHLATLALGEPGGDVDGSDPFVADYLRAELLAGLKPARVAFLRRTSILEHPSASLCDATLQADGSARELQALDRGGVFVSREDRAGSRYHYHPLFRDLLRAELERDEPELVPVLHARAAKWLEANGDPGAALEHALAANDVRRAARLFAAVAMQAWNRGRADELTRWLDELEARSDISAHPAAAAVGAWVHAFQGRAADATRLVEAAERRGKAVRLPDRTPVRAVLSLVRAAACGDGPEQMQRDVDSALAELPEDGVWAAAGTLLEGAAALLRGDRDAAGDRFAAAAIVGGRAGAHAVRLVALAQRSLIADAAGDPRAAEELALGGRDELEASELEGYAAGAIVRAGAARALLRHGRWDDARRELTSADAAASSLTHAVPWLAVETRLALGHAYVTLRDRASASGELAALEEIARLRPGLGACATEIDELRRAVEDLPNPVNGHNGGLTAAELRLIPLLATHLSFREIGERLFVSRNTIKTQAISAYRKLGVSSRSEAIERATELGLIDSPDADRRAAFTPAG